MIPNRHLGKVFFLVLTASMLSGCAIARSVRVTPGKGGVVAVTPRHSEEARAKAHRIMNQTCQGRSYEIVNEEEVVVGQVTTTRNTKDVQKKKKGVRVTRSKEQTTRNKTQWEITYRCR